MDPSPVAEDGRANLHRVTITDPVPDAQTFACPRCANEVSEPWYGPCPPCRDQLRATVAGEQHVLETDAYEPKMNVTPNAVAIKE